MFTIKRDVVTTEEIIIPVEYLVDYHYGKNDTVVLQFEFEEIVSRIAITKDEWHDLLFSMYQSNNPLLEKWFPNYSARVKEAVKLLRKFADEHFKNLYL